MDNENSTSNNQFDAFLTSLLVFASSLLLYGIVALILSFLTEFDPFHIILGVILLIIGSVLTFTVYQIKKKDTDLTYEGLVIEFQRIGRTFVIVVVGFIGMLFGGIIEYFENTA